MKELTVKADLIKIKDKKSAKNNELKILIRFCPLRNSFCLQESSLELKQ